jgi:rSAM/selenodomain-associated transferase 2/rSAM/selenodomain-associated transferase 1
MVAPTFVLAFTRFPVPGQVKTRLIPQFGERRAALWHRRMAQHTIGAIRGAAGGVDSDAVRIRVCSCGADRRRFRAWLGKDLEFEPQVSGNIGDRMAAAFRSAFHDGAASALAVGTDVPELSPAVLRSAVEGLRHHDIVLGPAVDGGYYLIGMRRPRTELFRGMEWGTAGVCEQTRDIIRRHGWSSMILDRLQDVDRPEDVARLCQDPRFARIFKEKEEISIIIPALNEAGTIERTLESLVNQGCGEIIVSDGGSSDGTLAAARSFGAVVMEVSGGRAAQQNAGAVAARGELLFFLHADTVPPSGFADLIWGALEDPSIVAGAFRFQTDSGRVGMRLIERSAHLRSSIFGWPYGDQGLFLEKRVFEEEGRFADLPILEDFDLVARLRRRGRIVTLNRPAITSSRRWQRRGILATTLINQLMVAGYFAKIPVSRLERFYKAAGSRSPAGIDPT